MDDWNGECQETKNGNVMPNAILSQLVVSCFLIAGMVSGCSGVYSSLDFPGGLPTGVKARSSDLAILSGVWEYREGPLVFELILDDHGNGSYNWHDGYLRTTNLSHQHWEGTWHQPGNEREGGFEAQLSDDAQSAEGRWWYTRIGTNQEPQETDGHFSLVRKDF